jgi:hypothetical protein
MASASVADPSLAGMGISSSNIFCWGRRPVARNSNIFCSGPENGFDFQIPLPNGEMKGTVP